MNLPNKLTVLRILLVPLFVIFISMKNNAVCQMIGLGIFIIASLTDLADGKIARSRNLVTDFGKFMDPIADKLLVMSALIILVEQNRMPGWVCMLMLAREDGKPVTPRELIEREKVDPEPMSVQTLLVFIAGLVSALGMYIFDIISMLGG